MQHLKIYLDGEFVNEPDAKVSVFDHGLLYGDGVFEGIRFYNGRVFLLEEHLDRLYDSAKAILLTVPLERDAMREAVLETCRQNSLRDGYIRLVITRGKGDLGLNPNKCHKPTIFIIAATIELYPEKYYTEGLRVNTVPTQRISPAALSPAIKSLNYLNNILAKIEGNLYGAQESIMLNAQGYVAECTADNIFVIKKDQIFTPHISDGALGGITRRLMFELARRNGPRDQGDQPDPLRSLRGRRNFRHRLRRGGRADQRGGRPQDRAGPGRADHVGVHPPLQGAHAKYRRSHLLNLYYIGAPRKRAQLNL